MSRFVSCSNCLARVGRSQVGSHMRSKICAVGGLAQRAEDRNYHACPRSVEPILAPYLVKWVMGAPVEYWQRDVIYFTGRYRYTDGRVYEAPFLFVGGIPGMLAKHLKAKPLKWSLQQLARDSEIFKRAQVFAQLKGSNMDAALSRYVGQQWKKRKGSHKGKEVTPYRAKSEILMQQLWD